MGVKGLAAYGEREWRKPFTFPIKYVDEDTRILIVDGLSTQRIFFPDPAKLDLCGMETLVYNFVHNFRRCGFKLVVVFDATISPSKIVTWASRRANEINAIRRYQSDQTKSSKPFSVLFASSYLASAFRRAGVDVYFSIDDADAVCAYLCQSLNAYGVLSKDSDYFIFNIPIYLDVASLSMADNGEIFCFGYERESIRSYMKLDCSGMRLLAQILGNDVTETQSKLIRKASKAFRAGKKRGKRRSKDEMKALAWYINEYRDNLSLNTLVDGFYTPRPPAEGRRALEICLAQEPTRVFLRLAFDDLSQQPVHSLLCDFRKSVYRRLGLKMVMEFTATESRQNLLHAFRTPQKHTIDSSIEAAEEPADDPSDLLEQVLGICEVFITFEQKRYMQLLRSQYYKRDRFRTKFQDKDWVPVPRFAFHVRALFLQVYEFLVLGFTRPSIFELFDTKLFFLMVGHTMSQAKSETSV